MSDPLRRGMTLEEHLYHEGPVTEAIEMLVTERDEARAEVERLEAEVEDLKENLDYALRRVEAVAKLRASPTLT